MEGVSLQISTTEEHGRDVIVNESTHLNLPILVGAFLFIDWSFKGSPNLISGEPFG